jgi:hypothetical protein
MSSSWSDERAARVRQWCDKVAVLAVDGLKDAGLISKGDFERASRIVAEEILVRLCLEDYPPAASAKTGN